MIESAREFLQQILKTPSPAGYEVPVQDVVRQHAISFADEVSMDVHGNVIASLNPGASLQVVLASRCDQIGMVVSYIDEKGYLYARSIGECEPQQLIGQRMTVWTKSGPVAAAITRKPIHLLDKQETRQTVKLEELWLDTGAKDQDEAKDIVSIGDPVTFELRYRQMRNDVSSSPGMANKAALWVVIEALRRVRRQSRATAVNAVSGVQEEIGLRDGPNTWRNPTPQVGIAVDVTHATDCPTIDERQWGEVKLGGGPVIYRGPNMNAALSTCLMKTADTSGIPYQLGAIGQTIPSGRRTIRISQLGGASGLIGIPTRYMHSAVESISLKDIDWAADLLAKFSDDLSGEEDFTQAI